MRKTVGIVAVVGLCVGMVCFVMRTRQALSHDVRPTARSSARSYAGKRSLTAAPVREAQTGSPATDAGKTDAHAQWLDEEGLAPTDAVDSNDSASNAAAMDVDALASLDTASLCSLLASLIGKGESEATTVLCDELAARGDEAVPSLETMLASGNPAVETLAMRMLIRIGTPSSIVPAMARVVSGYHSDARDNLVKQFSSVRSRAVAEVLSDMVRLETREDPLHCLCQALRSMEGGEVVEVLANAAQTADDPSVSAYYLDILAGMNRSSGVPALEALLDAGQAGLRPAAASALATIGSGKACEILVDHAAQSPYCVEALAHVTSPYAQKTLLDIARKHRDKAVRNAARTALASYKSPELASELASLWSYDLVVQSGK